MNDGHVYYFGNEMADQGIEQANTYFLRDLGESRTVLRGEVWS